MKLLWFVPSLIGVLCLAAPARAGQLTTWQFYGQNRLEFTTDTDVQPRAQLVFDPTRLVIDLPGIYTGDSGANQTIGGAIQQVRIGQFDAQTTRIVVEFAPGYTIDPQQVRFRGLSPTQWIVQILQPQRSTASSSSVPSSEASSQTGSQANFQADSQTPGLSTSRMLSTGSSQRVTANSPVTTNSNNSSVQATASRSEPAASSSRSTAQATSRTARSAFATDRATISRSRDRSETSTAATAQPSSASATTRSNPAVTQSQSITQISGIQITDAGLLIQTQGADPKVAIERSRSGRTITIRLDQAQLASAEDLERHNIDRHGIDDLKVDQTRTAVEIELDVSRQSPDWQARINQAGVMLFPEAEVAAAAKLREPESPTRSVPSTAVGASGSTTSTVAEQPSPARLSDTAAPRTQLATIQGIDLDLSGNQLLIQADRPVAQSSQWQGGMYVIRLSPAQLAARVTGPQLTPVDPLRLVRLRQEDSQTVVISVQPTPGVQFGSLNLLTPQLLALELQRPAPTAIRSGQTASQTLPSVIPNGRIVVAIDPGHGGADVGAVGIGNIHEADIVLPIAQQVASLLQQQGIQAVLTRSNDVEIDLEPRVQTAEQIGANLFVSIHANSMGMERPDVNGIETYYYSNGEALAQTIQTSIVNNLGVNDRGIRQARFYVLKRTSMPAVLVETGYVTGSEDAPRLADRSFQNQMAIAIARGILQYIQQHSLTGSR